jgi:hypothetical protein
MTTRNKQRLRLFALAYMQVLLVAANTVFISQYELLGNAVTALLISYVWTHNVKKIAIGTEADRWTYAVGAMLGSVSGTVIARSLL